MIKIRFDEDGQELKLPDISYDKFTEHLFKQGASDMEYEKYCKVNGFISDLTNINSETTNDITLVAENENSGRVLKFKCVYDSANDSDFDENDYFKTK